MTQEARIQRIREMEVLLERALADPQEAEDALAQLAAYYSSPLWLQDYEADEAGLLPADLKRGVLSQDTLYDLLMQEM